MLLPIPLVDSWTHQDVFPLDLKQAFGSLSPQETLSQFKSKIDYCLPGSLPYIHLIMNITHKQWKASLGQTRSNITKIPDYINSDNNSSDIMTSYNTNNLSDIYISEDTKTRYYQNFTDGAIYWKHNTGAHEVHGEIYEKWKQLSLECSFLGYPITGERSLQESMRSISYFQGGAIMWTRDAGAVVIHSKDFMEYFHSNSSASLPDIDETAAAARMNKDLGIEIIFEGIDFPTSMAFLESDDILILEKNKGTVKRIINGSLIPDPLLDVNVASRGERGMLGIAVASDNQLSANGSGDNNNNNFKSIPVNNTLGAEQQQTSLEQSSGFARTFVFLLFTESRTKDTSDICEELLENEMVGNRLYRYEFAPNNTKIINPKLVLSLPATFSAIH